MTEPGAPIAPQPGWWPRPHGFGSSVNNAFRWDTAAAVGAALFSGHASGGWSFHTAAAIGHSPVSIVGAVNGSATTSVAVPAHAVGNIIVLCAYNSGANLVPGKPAAAGTVPAFAEIDSSAGNSNAIHTVQFVATATNHTSGVWTNTTAMMALVLTGNNPTTPVGGHAVTNGSDAATITAPSVTLAHTDGTSQILHFFGMRSTTGTWSAAPAGYTQRYAVTGQVACDIKDVTTSDGSCAQTTSNRAAAPTFAAATVEIRT